MEKAFGDVEPTAVDGYRVRPLSTFSPDVLVRRMHCASRIYRGFSDCKLRVLAHNIETEDKISATTLDAALKSLQSFQNRSILHYVSLKAWNRIEENLQGLPCHGQGIPAYFVLGFPGQPPSPLNRPSPCFHHNNRIKSENRVDIRDH